MNKSKSFIILSIILLTLLLAGMTTYPDYGLSTDEYAVRYRALVTANYIGGIFHIESLQDPTLPQLSEYSDQDHGVLFDLFAFGIEKLTHTTDLRDVFIQKHLINYLVFLIAVLFLFLLVKERFKSDFLATVAALMLVLSPRIYADAFTNPKDLIFTTTYLVALYTAFHAIKKPTAFSIIIHGLATGISIASRVTGIMLIPLTFGFLFIHWLGKRTSTRSAIISFISYLGLSGIFTYALWPMLWEHPIQQFTAAFSSLSNYVIWSKEVLFMGQFILSTELPWYFVPGWIAVSTPIVFLILMLAGILTLLYRLIVRNKFKFWLAETDEQDLFILVSFVGPIISIIVLQSVIYDGWRHLYFVYPSLIYLAMLPLSNLMNKKSARLNWIKWSSLLFLCISFISTGFWMVKAHPLQNVYFNKLARTNWKTHYDLDYWGLANRASLEKICSEDDSSVIYIAQASAANIQQSFHILSDQDQSRLVFVNDFDLDSREIRGPLYIFNNYKRLKDPYLLDDNPLYSLYDQTIIDEELILSVYKYEG